MPQASLHTKQSSINSNKYNEPKTNLAISDGKNAFIFNKQGFNV